MSPTQLTPTRVIGRVSGDPYVSDDADGSIAGFVISAEQFFTDTGPATPSSYRVVCAGRWIELVRAYVKHCSPVFVSGDAVTPACGRCQSPNKAAWLLCAELIPLGRFPNPAVETDAHQVHELAA